MTDDPADQVAAAEAGEAAVFAALRAALLVLDLPPGEEDGSLARLLDRVGAATDALRRQRDLAAGANCLDGAAAGAIETALAAEAAAATLKEAVDQLGAARMRAAKVARETRAALAELIRDCGLAELRSAHHRCDPLAGTERVEITDPDKLPGRYWRHREPEPDKLSLLAELRLGPVPGARIVRGPDSVRISNRRTKGDA